MGTYNCAQFTGIHITLVSGRNLCNPAASEGYKNQKQNKQLQELNLLQVKVVQLSQPVVNEGNKAKYTVFKCDALKKTFISYYKKYNLFDNDDNIIKLIYC